MKTLSLSLLLSVFAVACNNNPPALGTIIDRMGRPAINTAVTDPFDLVSGKTVDQAKDAYNASSLPAGWIAFAPQFAATLAVLDSLDQVCGNQLAAKPLSAGSVPVDRYQTLAAVLTDDELFVNTGSGTCELYLGAEADATGLTVNNGDCGGRTPLEDVADETYSLVAAGVPAGVTDGVNSDADGPSSLTDFPFLRAPN